MLLNRVQRASMGRGVYFPTKLPSVLEYVNSSSGEKTKDNMLSLLGKVLTLSVY